MRILLTGAEGYIGSRLSKVLLEAGHQVKGLDAGFYSGAEFIKEPKGAVPITKKDIRATNVDDLADVEAVIHLAELCNDPLGELDPQLTHEINHLGTKRLSTLAKKAGVARFIYFSSCSVYGASDEILDESSPTNPVTAYAKSKIQNERFLKNLAGDGFSPTILRLATVYGTSPRMRFDLAVNNLAGLAWTEGAVKMESNGEPWRPFIHVLDVCRAVSRVLASPQRVVHNQVLNVGDNNSNYQIKKIARIISEVFANCETILNPRGIDKRNYRVSFDKINSVLPGFKCINTVREGAVELKKAFQKTQLDGHMFKSPEFTRLRQMQELLKHNLVDNKLFWVKTHV